jgi:glycosyltransferase involved in cell wall biosynthesis
MSESKISVVMTSYNGAKYIQQQIESILAQTLPPEEVIICDDNSSDGTWDIIAGYTDEKRIKSFRNTQQLGITRNFQKGCGIARQGNWIAFADQDDVWLPQKLSVLSDKMRFLDDAVQPALVYSDLSVINSADHELAQSFWKQQRINIDNLSLPVILFGNAITGCTMLLNSVMKSEFLKMQNAVFLHDEWLALIAHSFGKNVAVREALVKYRQHENNVTYSENYKVPTFLNRVQAEFQYLFGKKNFISVRVSLAKAFLAQYRSRLSSSDIAILERFVALESKSYITQRINRFRARLQTERRRRSN